MPTPNRRDFLKTATGLAAGLACSTVSRSLPAEDRKYPLYRISLAEWSLHKTLFGGDMDHLDFAKTAKEEFGIEAVEYVNQFFKDKAQDQNYLADMKQRCDDLGVKSKLIMIDGEGHLGDPDDAKRAQAVDNHKKWVEAAAFLGCHSIRVNAASSGSYQEQMALAADGLHSLTLFAEQYQLNVIVENHGGLSSNGQWLSAVIRRVDHPHCGTLPDFGNFQVSDNEWYDVYQGVEEMMPYAQAVSAKSYEFDDDHPLVTHRDREGMDPLEIDYLKMMKIVTDAGYLGHVGIEYEGHELDEYEGIRRTKTMLEQVRDQLSA
jgi:L-ribulose-5-phosphate 3-epimerase